MFHVFYFSFGPFSSGWDFHMVCCCIKSNLTLLDQRLWWMPVCVWCALCSSLPFLFWGRSWIPKIGMFICWTRKCFSFFPAWIYGLLSRSVLLELLSLSPLTVIHDCQCHHVNFDNRKIRFNFHFQFSLRWNQTS